MKPDMADVYLGLGSNLGDRIKNLEKTVSVLSGQPGIRIASSSSLYETEPIGYTNQQWFINQVIRIKTALSPFELLSVIQKIEKSLGRERRIRWGPRTVDIDILLYSDMIIQDEALTIPHPLLAERRFVLIPLTEIAPALRHPVLGKRMDEILIDMQAADLIHRI